MKSEIKFPKRIILLAFLLFSIGVLPLAGIVGLSTVAGMALRSVPSQAGLKTVSWISRVGISLTRLYPLWLSKNEADFFSSAENKYLTSLLKNGLKNQVEATAAQGLSGSGDTQALFSALENQANNLLKQLEASERDRSLIAFGRELLPLAKWSMGFDRKKTFLIILQNSMEQRPTGGLIEGIGVAVFEKGKLLDISWSSPNDVEASLTGSEDAPFPIKSMLAQPKLLFRDANWAVDGPGSAAQIKKMYERAMGRGVDGVVFFSTAGLDDVLVAIGKDPVKEKMAFSGPEYISQIASDLSGSLKTFPFLTIKGLLNGLQNENILIIPFEADQAGLASLMGIDGGVKAFPCPVQFRSSQCSANFIYVADANLGANRADYFIKKNRRVSLVLDPLSPPSTVLDLAYLNTATVDNSASSYRGYTRAIIPLSSVVRSVVLIENGQTVQIPTDNYVELGRHFVGFSLEVKPGESKMIRITYVSTEKISIDRGVGGYVLNLKKQSGDSVSTEVEFKFPDEITPLAVYPEAKIGASGLNFKLPMGKSSSVAVEFAVNSLFR